MKHVKSGLVSISKESGLLDLLIRSECIHVNILINSDHFSECNVSKQWLTSLVGFCKIKCNLKINRPVIKS